MSDAPTSETRRSFVEHFGEEEASAVESAAHEHKNGVHDEKGSDPFRWAIVICLGYQCMEVESYRERHSITADWGEIQEWVKEHGDLSNHDGDVDYLALFEGVYNEYIPEPAPTEEDEDGD